MHAYKICRSIRYMAREIAYVFIVAALAACGGGTGSVDSGSSGSTEPSDINVGAFVTTTISVDRPSIALVGIAKVTFDAIDAANGAKLTIAKDKKAASDEIFSGSKELLDIKAGAPYEVVINSSAAPKSDASIEANVPGDLAAQLVEGLAIAIYYEIPEDDAPSTYRVLSSRYSAGKGLISASIPTTAFILQDDGTYKATLKVAIAQGDEESLEPIAIPSQSSRLTESSQSPIAINSYALIGLRCPLADGCLETSRFQPNRNGKLHRGVDFRAQTALPVFGALDGIVVQSLDDFGMLVVKSTVRVAGRDRTVMLRYLHLSDFGPAVNSDAVDVYKGKIIKQGEKFALSGNRSPTAGDYHLHVEYIIPTTKSCVEAKDAANKETCLFLKDFTDPFPSFIKNSQVVNMTNPNRIRFSLDESFQIALIHEDVSNSAISSDIVVTGVSQTRRVVWKVIDPEGRVHMNSSYGPIAPLSATAGSAFLLTPYNIPGVGKSNQATFVASVSGTYIITAEWEDTDLVAKYTVEVGQIAIKITPDKLSVAVGANASLVATDQYGEPIDNTENIVWSSSDPSIASIDARTGKVTGLAVGSVGIVATDQVIGSVSTTAFVTVVGLIPARLYLRLMNVKCESSASMSYTLSGGGDAMSGSLSLTAGKCFPMVFESNSRDSFIELKSNIKYTLTMTFDKTSDAGETYASVAVDDVSGGAAIFYVRADRPGTYTSN
jgi:murein DD-endopeptidase MepM/ murein hydrolase activator NlpD